MIERVVILSLIELGIYISMSDGMIFERLRIAIGNALDMLKLTILKKPIYECLTCMGGIYSIVLYPLLFGLDWFILPVIVAVIGLNSVLARIINYE